MTFPSYRCDYHDIQPVDFEMPVRNCIVDIECSDRSGWPNATRDAIICLTVYDSFKKDYVTFVLVENIEEATNVIEAREETKGGCFNSDVHTICLYTEESKMLRAFAEYIRSRDPDVLSGWNIDGFDMPYIFGRFEALRISPEILARLSGKSKRVEVRGRHVFDLLSGYEHVHVSKKESYRLDAIGKEELGEQKVRFTGKICDLDAATLVEYNFKDVELCVGIDNKDKIVEFHMQIARFVGCPLDRTLSAMQLVDTYVLRKAHGRYVLPSKRSGDSAEQFEGATVLTPIKGVHRNIAALDLTSLYPMAMMTINASPETKDPNGELVAPNGVRFKKSPDGIVREIQSELFKERDSLKKERNKHAFGSYEYNLFDLRQASVKVIMNAYYGVSGSPNFRLYDREIGDATTSVGRAILEHGRKLITGLKYKVIYGDTDCLDVKLPEEISVNESISVAKSLEKLLNDSYPAFAKEVLNADTSYFSVKFEKLYERFFSGGRKKRYAGLLVWKEGKLLHEIDIVGFEIKRSDSPAITKVAQKLLVESVLEGRDYEETRTKIREIVKKYRAGGYPLDEIGIPGGIGKALGDYESPDAQVRGAIYANEYLGANFGKGSKPKRVYVKAVPAGYPRTDVICFEYPDQVPPGFVVDRDVMLQKTIQAPLERLMESLNFNWIDFDPGMTTLSQWGM
jgi:DNA polymerase I